MISFWTLGRVPALLCIASAAFAAGPVLKPHKDSLFAYGKVLATADGGAHRTIDYDEMRDINARDEVPERRVRQEYVSLGVRRQQQDLSLATDAGPVSHFAVGRTSDASAIVVYLHGQGGSRKQGVDDFTFGGNFNRIKNLMADAGGLYLSPDFTDFEDEGAAEVAALIAHYSGKSPDAPVVVACGSMGGQLCWRLAENKAAAKVIGGYMLLGSLWDDGFLASPGFKAGIPVFFGHGSRDKVFLQDEQEAFFREILARNPVYPARFVSFEGGAHGTPIRMTDWRETLNWMFATRRDR